MHSSEELNASAPHGRPATLGELKASGHVYRTVKQEIRENLLTRMRAGQERFPGIVGFDQTVLPHVERALLAGHDVILLGERGQGKTRLIRTIGGLLDEWTPVVAGCEINDHPYAPVCARCRRLAAEHGDDLPVTWRHRSERYGEKLATPDTSVGDLIGDIDPVKVAEGRTLGDPETIHFGLVPRTNRGVFCLNELPDLAERIQVALLNVLEERDIGVRGYSLRLPLDIVLVASANPEDYTNRGRIITPLKDRFGAEVRTHYPLSLERRARADHPGGRRLLGRPGPGRRAARAPHRGHRAVHPPGAGVSRGRQPVRRLRPVRDRGRGVRRRGRGAAHRADRRGARRDAGRPGRRPAGHRPDAARQGRVRGQRGGPRGGDPRPPAAPRDRGDVPRPARRRRPDRAARQVRGRRHRSSRASSSPATELLRRTGEVPGLAKIMARLGMEGRESFGEAAAAIEFVLEGLYLIRRLSKDTSDGTSTYRT